MNMKKEEISCLQILKEQKGLSEKQIEKEIGDLIQSQYDFKKLKIERKKLIQRINYLEQKNEELKSKLFNYGLEEKKKAIKKDTKKVTINNLSRVLTMLRLEDKPFNQTELNKLCCLKPHVTRACIDFLLKNNLIEKVDKNMGSETQKYKIIKCR